MTLSVGPLSNPAAEKVEGLRRLSLRPPEWTRESACLSPDVNPRWWHSDRAQHITQARQVCAGCPVRLPCATGALERAEADGIWGGLDLKDRQKVAKRHGYDPPGRAAHGTRSRYVSDCRCPDCTRAHARYEHGRRLARRGATAVAQTSQETVVAVDAPPVPAVVEALQPAPVIDAPQAATVAATATPARCPRAGLPWRPTRRRSIRYHPLQLLADL